MTIKEQFGEISKKDLYKMTKAETTSVRDAVGVELKVSKYVIYDDVNSRGESVNVLSIMADDRSVYSTISETFKQRFMDIVETFGDELPETPILITEGTSRNGRQYASCTIA